MDRRRFLQTAVLAAGALPLAPSLAQAAADPYFEGFRRGLRKHDWLSAYQGVDSDLAAGPLRIEGRLPEGLRGTLFRNGPALFERAGVRYHHLFDGDGMIQAYRFTDRGLTHQGRFVRTRKYLHESERGAFVSPGFGTSGKQAPITSGPDAFNAANTNVVQHAGKLLALWEGGSAIELAPDSLETRGPVAWSAELKGVPFSAHPKIEPDGSLWNIGTFFNMLFLYHVAADGRLVKSERIKVPDLILNHDFVLSERYLINVIPAVRLDLQKIRDGVSFLDAMQFDALAPMRVLVVEKADFKKQRWYELPPGFVFHFGNAWEEGGVLRFDYVRYDDATIMTQDLRALMRGDVERIDPATSHSMRVRLDLATGRASQEAIATDVEFPRVDPRFVAIRNRHLYHVGVPVGRDRMRPSSILRLDLETGALDEYAYDTASVLEEHVMVARPGSSREGDGWLVGCAYDASSRRTSVNVFDALNLAAGPIARAWLPYGLPPGFHGNFQPG